MSLRPIITSVLFSTAISLFCLGALCVKGKGSNDRFNQEMRKDIKSVVTVLRDQIQRLNSPNSIVNTMNKLKRDVDNWVEDSTHTVTSYVDFGDLEKIDKDTSTLKALDPSVDSLFSKDRLDLIREVGDQTVLTGAAELRKLQRASDLRGAEISQLESSGKNLRSLRDGYKNTEETARAISDRLGDKVGDPAIEIYCLYNGRNFGLSWFDLSENLVPALQDRVSAADAALKRLDGAIGFAKADLERFDAARNFVQAIYAGTGNSPGSTSIRDIRENMVRSSDEAKKLASEYRQRAEEIRKANERIAAVQRLLGLGKSLGDLTGAVNGAGGGKHPTSYSFKYDVIILQPRNSKSKQRPVVVHPR